MRGVRSSGEPAATPVRYARLPDQNRGGRDTPADRSLVIDRAIVDLTERCGWRPSEVAVLVGRGRASVYRRMAQIEAFRREVGRHG